MKSQTVQWIIKLVVVVILLQTLFFKFTGAEESVYIFKTLGVEPYGRIGSGIVELIASVLLLVRRTSIFGALLSTGTMLGAVFSHIFVLGIEIKGDGGTLFVLALVTLLCSMWIVYIERDKLRELLRF